MWYHRKYINRRDWMLENLSVLDVNPTEFILLQVIDYSNSFNETLNIEILVEKTGFDQQVINEGIAGLNAKGYLKLKVLGAEVQFIIDGVFENHQDQQVVDKDLFEIFEDEFGRLLSQQDLVTLSKWNQMYDEKMILLALKEAIIAQKLSMQYINGILVNKAREAR